MNETERNLRFRLGQKVAARGIGVDNIQMPAPMPIKTTPAPKMPGLADGADLRKFLQPGVEAVPAGSDMRKGLSPTPPVPYGPPKPAAFSPPPVVPYGPPAPTSIRDVRPMSPVPSPLPTPMGVGKVDPLPMAPAAPRIPQVLPTAPKPPSFVQPPAVPFGPPAPPYGMGPPRSPLSIGPPTGLLSAGPPRPPQGPPAPPYGMGPPEGPPPGRPVPWEQNASWVPPPMPGPPVPVVLPAAPPIPAQKPPSIGDLLTAQPTAKDIFANNPAAAPNLTSLAPTSPAAIAAAAAAVGGAGALALRGAKPPVVPTGSAGATPRATPKPQNFPNTAAGRATARAALDATRAANVASAGSTAEQIAGMADKLKTPAERAAASAADDATKAAAKTAGRLRLAGGLVIPGTIAAAVETADEAYNGYKEKFDTSLGVDRSGPWESLGNDFIRGANNVVNSTLFGLPNRIGSGLSAKLSGGEFSEGFSNTHKDKFNEAQNMSPGDYAAMIDKRNGVAPAVVGAAAAPTTAATVVPAAPKPPVNPYVAARVVPGSEQSKQLVRMGIPVSDQNKAPVDTEARFSRLRDGTGTSGGLLQSKTSEPGITNLGSYGGDSNIYATASKPGGRLDTFTGVGAHTEGDSSKPLSEQEQARKAIVEQVKLGNPQAIQSYAAMRIADANARVDAAKNRSAAEVATGDKTRAIEKEGNANYNNIVKGLFADSDNPKKGQEDFNSFVANTDLQEALGLGEDTDGDNKSDTEAQLSRLPPDEMKIAVARLRSMMELQNNARSAGAVNSTGFTPAIGEERESEFWRDAWTGNMSRWDYMLQAIGADSDKVQDLGNGKVVSMDRYIGEDGSAETRKSALEDYKARNRLREAKAADKK